jgi:hypothetical protein
LTVRTTGTLPGQQMRTEAHRTDSPANSGIAVKNLISPLFKGETVPLSDRFWPNQSVNPIRSNSGIYSANRESFLLIRVISPEYAELIQKKARRYAD